MNSQSDALPRIIDFLSESNSVPYRQSPEYRPILEKSHCWDTQLPKNVPFSASFRGEYRLLKPMKDGNYVAIVEHENQETFMAMHNSLAHDEAAERVGSLLDGNPSPQFYEAIIE